LRPCEKRAAVDATLKNEEDFRSGISRVRSKIRKGESYKSHEIRYSSRECLTSYHKSSHSKLVTL